MEALIFGQLEESIIQLINQIEPPVMKQSTPLLLTWILLFTQMTPISVWAEGQDIKIQLELAEKNKVTYVADALHPDDPIKIPISLKCSGAQNIYINKSFTAENIFYKMRVIAPNGHQVFPKRRNPSGQYHQMPPLPYGLYDDDPNDLKPSVPVRFAPCKVFGKMDKGIDIGKLYNLKNPGYYTAQAEVSTMIFENGTCNIDAAPRVGLSKPWIGLLKSNTISFCIAGSGKVEIEGNKIIWKKSWATNNSNKLIKFSMPYESGRTSANYDKNNVYLNCKVKLRAELSGNTILANINESDCIRSLGDVETKKQYTIAITGRLTTGRFYGGHAKITLIE